jgi:large-conductance mechanosensitive channel
VYGWPPPWEEVGRRPEVNMKFLVVVLAIHFIVELINNIRKTERKNTQDEINEKVFHPSEFRIR